MNHKMHEIWKEDGIYKVQLPNAITGFRRKRDALAWVDKMNSATKKFNRDYIKKGDEMDEPLLTNTLKGVIAGMKDFAIALKKVAEGLATTMEEVIVLKRKVEKLQEEIEK